MEFDPSFWADSSRLWEVVALSVAFYVTIVLLTRLSGKRTTGQMNNFDWIITVAVGSLAASGILLRDVSYAEATVAIVALGLCQYAVTFVLVRSSSVTKAIKAEPTLLLHKGVYLEDAMKRTRITKSEIESALRHEGILDPAGANWVVLETDGTLAVIGRDASAIGEAETMDHVERPDNLPA
ncbi:DUF421 domain-containing protein [Altererythrobacter marinus]|jgi:uncharacterized membrane protein YcaP (DUF421 family)|uniref:DUF421 domain-containing protein n=1 Tax=Pelagerythrobacter marinus TaxID=538382 RepID=A0ABW9UYI2_9SPHN|nr:YetF domain-containing protein [Pelagerythrobacter marinus]MXO69856.1 DUF421 domain-containing protein [Pelagerythrobacter marinus]